MLKDINLILKINLLNFQNSGSKFCCFLGHIHHRDIVYLFLDRFE
jgi:hypothetical protein